MGEQFENGSDTRKERSIFGDITQYCGGQKTLWKDKTADEIIQDLNNAISMVLTETYFSPWIIE